MFTLFLFSSYSKKLKSYKFFTQTSNNNEYLCNDKCSLRETHNSPVYRQHCQSSYNIVFPINIYLFIYLQSNRKYAYLVFSFRFYFHYFTISTTYSLKTRIYFCYLVTEPFNHVGNLTQIVTTNSHNKRDKNRKN